MKMTQPIEKTVGVYRAVPDDAEIVFRWGTTERIPARRFVVNSAEAMRLTYDKTEFRRLLQGKELCPETWFDAGNVRFPAIVRPRHHSQGQRLYKVETNEQLLDAIRQCGVGWYANEFINKVAEYRVFIAQGRAVWVTKKTPGNPQDIAWNVARGGRFDNVKWEEWPLKVIKYSIEAMKLCDLDFGGVDVMVDKDGEAYVLEINAAPSQTSDYRQGCVAKVFDYIIRTGNANRIPLIEQKGGYKKFIHPAVCQEAIVAQ